ncbi:MAG: hypothetical protein DRZ90_08025 [Spirochaetes bacterium]|nr:MAG: hypothetical protein DRZ90_08025 [Spirochaetota bacterium]
MLLPVVPMITDRPVLITLKQGRQWNHFMTGIEAHFPETTAAYKWYTEPSPTVGGILQAPIMNISARWFIRLPLAMVCPDVFPPGYFLTI